MSKSNDVMSKFVSEKGKLQNAKDSQLELIESLKTREGDLKSQYDSMKNRYDAEVNGRKREKEELEKENQTLSKKLNELDQELSSIRSSGAFSSGGVGFRGLGDYGDEDYDEDQLARDLATFGSEGIEEGLESQNKNLPHLSGLESETMKSSLGHAHKLVANLQRAFSKEKSEKFEIRRQLSEAQSELQKLRSSNAAKTKRSKYPIGGTGGNNGSINNGLRSLNPTRSIASLYGPSGKVKTNIIDDNNEVTGHVEGWEDVTIGPDGSPIRRHDVHSSSESDVFQSAFESGFETAQEGAPTEDDIYQTGQETMDEGSSGEHTETEDSVVNEAPTFFNPRRGSVSSTASDSPSDNDYDVTVGSNSSVNSGPRTNRRRSFKNRRSTHTLRSSTYSGGGGASDREGTPVKGSASGNLATEFMSAEEIDRHAAEHGLVALPVEEYELLLSKADLTDNPSKDHLQVSANQIGYELIPTCQVGELETKVEELKSHSGELESQINKSQTKDYIETYASQLGFELVPSGHTKDLESQIANTQSKDYFFDNAKTHNLIAIPIPDYEKYTTPPTLDELTRHADQFDHKVLPKDQYEKLTAPPIDDITRHAENLGYRAIPVKEYDRLIHETTRSLTGNEISEIAKGAGLVTLPVYEHSELIRSTTEPTVDEVERYAERVGMTLLVTDDYKKLINLTQHPTYEDLAKWSSPLGLTVIDDVSYRDLQREAKNPTPEELTARSQQLGLTVLPQAEYQNLINLNQQPPKSHLEEQAQKYNALLVDKEDYAKLTALSNHPDRDHITDKARLLGLTVVADSDYKQLLDTANVPSHEHIRAKAAAIGLVTVAATEHDNLLRLAHDPTKQELETKALDSHGSVLLDKSEHDELIRQVESPTAEELKYRAGLQNLITLENDSHSELVRRANEPSLSELERSVEKYSHIIIPQEEHSKLISSATSPSESEVIEHAKGHGLVTVPTAKYEDLIRKKTKEEAAAAVRDHGMVALTSEQYQTMSDAANQPVDKNFVESAAAGLGLATIAPDELELLRNPPEKTNDEIRDIADVKGYSLVKSDLIKTPDGSNPDLNAPIVALTRDTYDKLVNPSKEEVESKAKGFGLVALTESEHQSLIREPSKEELVEKLQAQHNLISIHKDEYDDLSSRPKEFKPSKEEISSIAATHGLSTVSSDHLEQIKKDAEDPNQEKIESISAQRGFTLIPSERVNELQRKAEAPSQDELGDHASKLGLSIIDSNELETIRTKATNPTREELEEASSRQGLAIIAVTDFENLKRKANTPSKGELDSHAAQLGLAAVSIGTLEELHRKSQNPNKEEVEQFGSNLGLRVLSENEHNQLQRRVNNPTVDELETSAASLHKHSVLPKDELEELRRKANSPTIDELKLAGESKNMILVSKDVYDELEKNASEPDEAIVTNFAKKLGLSVLPVVELEQLRDQLSHPSKTDVELLAKKHNLVAVPKDTYAEISEKAEKFDKNENNFPTKDVHLLSVAAKRNHFEDIIKQSSKDKQSDKVAESIKSLGYVPVSNEEYKRLLSNQSVYEPTKGDIIRTAKTFGLAAITVEEYKSLLKRGHSHMRDESSNSVDSFGSSISGTPGERASVAPSTPVRSTAGQDFLFDGSPRSGTNDLDMKAVPAEYLASLRRIAENPTEQDVTALAHKVGLRVVSGTGDDEHIKNTMSQSSSVKEISSQFDPPEDVNTVSISAVEYAELKKKANQLSSPEGVHTKASELGLVAIGAAELEKLRTSQEPIPITEDDIHKKASELGLVTLTESDYKSLSEHNDASTDRIKELAQSRGLVVVPEVEFSELQQLKGLSADDFKQQAESHGFAVLPISELEQLQELKQLSVDEVKEHADAYGLSTVPKDELIQLQQQKNLSVDEIKGHADYHGMVVLPKDELSDLQRNREFNPDELQKLAESHGLAVLPLAELSQSQGTTDLSLEDIKHHAEIHGLVALPQTETPKELDPEEIRQHAEIHGLIVLPKDELLQLKAPKEYSASDVKKYAEDLGLAMLTKEELSKLQTPKEVSDDDIKQHAENHGLVLLPKNELVQLQQPQQLSYDEVQRQAEHHGLVSMSEEQFHQLQQPKKLGSEDIESAAAALGLVTVSSVAYNEFVKSQNQLKRKSLSPEELSSHAEKVGYVAIPETEYNSLKSPVFSPSVLQRHAGSLGLRTISDTEYRALIAKSEPKVFNNRDLENEARSRGKVLLDSNEYAELMTNTSKGVRAELKDVELSPDVIKSSAERLGLAVISASELEALRSVKESTIRESRGSPITVVNRNSRFNMQSAVLDDTGSEMSADGEESTITGIRAPHVALPSVSEYDFSSGYEQDGVQQQQENQGTTRLLPPAGITKRSTSAIAGPAAVSLTTASGASALTPNGHHQTQDNHRLSPASNNANALFNLSQATIVSQNSLSERNMIPYITQVVIGEFLFKYTRSFGISGISDNRHERYFWIHPYTLTLYWSKENPAMESLHSGKTKSAAIVHVEAVEDLNPLPPGLYHKSIVIQTSDRVIKITCPSRQRHNIWYNSIKYLLKRSIDDLTFDEELGDVNYAEDRRVARERSRTSAFTGTSLRENRVLSLRQSLAPEMNVSRMGTKGSFRRESVSSFKHSSQSSVQRAPSSSTSRSSSRFSRG